MYNNPMGAEQLWSQGIDYLTSQNYNKAIECFDKALEIDSKYVPALIDKGIALLNLERYEDAIECYDKAIEIEPKNAYARFNKGNTLSNLKRYEDAIKYFDQALEIDPKDADTLTAKGSALYHLAKYEEALQCVDKALEIEPKLAGALIGKTVVLYHLKRYKEALQCVDKALEIEPKLARALIGKGLVYYGLTKYEEAMKYFDKALEIDPNEPNAWLDKGVIFENLGRYEEAIKCYNTFLKVKETDDDAYFYRGQSKCAAEDYTGALEDFNKVRRGQFAAAEKSTSIGQCYYELGFYEDAEKEYREAIKSNPKLVRAYYNLAVLYASENKYDRAKKQLETGYRIDRNFSVARDAIKKLEGLGQSDWYGWWFGDDSDKGKMYKDKDKKSKKKVGFKPILGMIVITSIALLMIVTIILAFMYPSNLAASVVAALTFSIAILVGVLLLPSLRRFKAAGIELEPALFAPGTIKLRASSYVMSAKSLRM
jgi:tetratricopeptide (TPR) repeat protein